MVSNLSSLPHETKSPNTEPADMRASNVLGWESNLLSKATSSSSQSTSPMTATKPRPNTKATGLLMKSPPDFFATLPNELITTIADHVDQAELPALRSVSKLVHGNCNNRFATEFFEDVPVIMSRKSLNANVDIAAHKIFGPYIKSITFNAVQLSEDLRFPRVYVDDDHPERHTFLKLLKEQDILEESGEALHLFTQALKIIKKHGHVIRLDLDDYETSAIGFTALWGKSWYLRRWEMTRSSTLTLMITAAINSRCNFQALEFYIAQHDRSLGFSSYTIHPIWLSYSEKAAFRGMFFNLLAIGFTYHCPLCSISRRTLVPMADMLRFASRIETLDLAFGLNCLDENGCDLTCQPWQIFGECAKASSTSSLSTLRFSNLAAREEDCLEFLAKSCASLQSLELEDCVLWDGGCWKRVLVWIRDRLSLEKLKIRGLYIHVPQNDHQLECVVESDENWKFDGAEQVKEGLDNIVRRFEATESTNGPNSADEVSIQNTAHPS